MQTFPKEKSVWIYVTLFPLDLAVKAQQAQMCVQSCWNSCVVLPAVSLAILKGSNHLWYVLFLPSDLCAFLSGCYWLLGFQSSLCDYIRFQSSLCGYIRLSIFLSCFELWHFLPFIYYIHEQCLTVHTVSDTSFSFMNCALSGLKYNHFHRIFSYIFVNCFILLQLDLLFLFCKRLCEVWGSG